MRAFGGAPMYWLTDNERTVTIDHVAGIAVRHPEIVAVGGHYGITVATCVPADPESKGGSEATVRVAKAQGIRNPQAHPSENISEQEALEQLAALSVLARWVDECEVVSMIGATTGE